MKWPSMCVWLLVSVCGLSVPPSVAEVAHVSINLRMFDVGKLPLLKINIVSNISDTDRLQFIMHQAGGDERLMVSRINDFMLLVQGVDEVTDKQAVLQVKEYRDNYWFDVAALPLFIDSVPVGSPPDNKKLALYKQQTTVPLHSSGANVAKATAEVQPAAKVVKPLTASVTTATPMPAPVLLAAAVPATSETANVPTAMPVVALATNTASVPSGNSSVDQACTLEYNGEQTLWRLASRYSKEWQTNVYAAALGIFESNPKAFAKGKPSGLKRDAILHCPNIEALAQYGDKSSAEKKFDSLL